MTARTSEKLVGSGISERKRSFRHFDVDDLEQSGALKEAFSRMVAVSQDPWARLAPVLAGAELQLRDLEDSGLTTEEDFRERHGMGWYLRQMLMHAKLVRHHIDAGNASWAAIEALSVGELITEMGVKHDWEADALSGRKARRGAESTRKGLQADRVAAVDRLCAPTNPNRIKKTAAFAVVAESEGVAAKTIETDYYKAKRKASPSRD